MEKEQDTDEVVPRDDVEDVGAFAAGLRKNLGFQKA